MSNGVLERAGLAVAKFGYLETEFGLGSRMSTSCLDFSQARPEAAEARPLPSGVYAQYRRSG